MSSGKVTRAQDLIHSSSYVHTDVSIKEAQAWFVSQPDIRCLAVLNQTQERAGIVTRENVFQFICEKGDVTHPVSEIMNAEPFTIPGDTPVDELIETFISSQIKSPHFHEDIVVFGNGRFAGLIAVQDLLCSQLSLNLHRLVAMEAQQAALIRQNKDLFEQSFKHGQKETQYRSFLDHVPVPTVVFDLDGSFVDASSRFFRLTGVTKRADDHLIFGDFFKDDFGSLSAESGDYGTDTEWKQQVFHTLTLQLRDKPVMAVQATVEQSNEWGHIIISIMSLGSGNTIAPGSIADLVLETSPNPPGKITQAIKVKVKNESPGGLARKVANTLVDREPEITRLMSKLEKIIEVAHQVEQVSEKNQPAMPATPEQADDQRQHLKGSLREFSVIDLCQILIQGQKSGQLLLFRDGDAELYAYIYFAKGQFVHGKLRGASGEVQSGDTVLSKILKLKNGHFDFIFNKEPSAITIHGDAMQLLMEACRQADEAAGAS